MKILLTSVGRRVELVQALEDAARRLHVDLEIVGGDTSSTAPALQFCSNSVMLPLIRDNSYIPFLIDYCEQEHVDALIPTIDTDLLVLAENRDKFSHTQVVISSPEKVRICRDKRFTAEYFMSVGLKSPMPVDNSEEYVGGFPAFIKPKDGSSSINAFKGSNEDELNVYCNIVPDYIIQPFVSGTEYTIDIFCNFEGDPIYITPRIRLAVRSGEVLKTKIVQDQKIIDEMKQLVADYKPCGAITVQMIRDDLTKEDYYIEINPRFGGGAPLSMKAGADSAEAMIRLLSGEQLCYFDKAAEDGAIYSRFDQSVRVDK